MRVRELVNTGKLVARVTGTKETWQVASPDQALHSPGVPGVPGEPGVPGVPV